MISMKELPFFSIIVPVYNVEPYLEDCINSIMSQTFESFELILVDDGSTDSSGKICDVFSQNYTNIIVTHKKNGGLSSARNVGIGQSRGDYVIFVDGDDMINDDCFLSNLFSAITENGKPDVALYPNALSLNTYTHQIGRIRKNKFDSVCVMSAESDLRRIVEDRFIAVAAWTKAVSREVIVENNLLFVEGETSEDFEWTFHILCKARTYVYLNGFYYVYRHRPGSITDGIDSHALDIMCRQIDRLVALANEETDESKRKVLFYYISNMFLGYLFALAKTGMWKEHIAEVKRFDFLFRFTQSGRGRIIRLTRRIFGYGLTFCMLAFVYQFTHSGRGRK